LIGTALFLALGCAGLAYVMLVDADRHDPLSARAAASDDESPSRATELLQTSPSREDEVAESARSSAAVSSSDPAKARAISIEGRVVLPPGTPSDELAVVVAEVEGAWRRECSRSPIASDGVFRVSFPSDTSRGRLRLDARYVYLAEAVTLNPQKHAADIELHPALGAILRARGSLPAIEAGRAAQIVGQKVDLWSAPSRDVESEMKRKLVRAAAASEDGNDVVNQDDLAGFDGITPRPPGTFRETRKLGSDLAVEFRALPPDLVYSIDAAFGPIWSARRDDIELRAGSVTEVDLDLRLGVSIRGRVEDDIGAPVSGARIIGASSRRGERDADVSGFVGRSKPDGSFKCFAIPPGDITLSFNRDGRVAARWSGGEHAEGDEVDGIVIVMERGSRISGVVRWPADQERRQCTVVARPHPESDVVGRRVASITATAQVRDDGTFELSGLESKPMDLSVDVEYTKYETDRPQIEPGSAPDARETGPRHPLPARERRTWVMLSARRELVEPGSTNVVLELQVASRDRGRLGAR
jgi:hypothetical protein